MKFAVLEVELIFNYNKNEESGKHCVRVARKKV